MARLSKSFQDQAKERYDEITGEIAKLEADLKGIKNEKKSIASYLQSIGVIEKAKRAPRKQSVQREKKVSKP